MKFHYIAYDVGSQPGFTENFVYNVEGDSVRIDNFTEADGSVGPWIGDTTSRRVSRAAARSHLRDLLATRDDYNGIGVSRLD
tara:strand:- start:7625 stop:7870 length:246 start_codon:yes stop_codon:yes gene_type:complete